MKKYLIAFFVLTVFLIYSASSYAKTNIPVDALKVDYKLEIEKLISEEFDYQLKQYDELNEEEKEEFSKNVGIVTDDYELFKKELEESL
ncbi:hypothetical protein [Dehalobacterium formicoaceticum]|uniref:Uncharacterized protein n=1 Tax=Dehalobacterium formicoaceticum TaxID=51515 RepID=A0ABT1Y4T5_9FIRM|nr:hypothetical protein [Dehalobacterium formicoaceticum]MCR6545506.1 hypothetical protein [Dehalobacterium formicoaceticum]